MGRRAIDLTGCSYGALKVIGRDSSAQSGCGKHAKWICRCELCGRIISIKGSDLRSGRATDCGCKFREKCGRAHLVDRVGDTYGFLTVIRRDLTNGVKSGMHAKWICRCNLCGAEESVAANLISEFGKDRCHNCMKKSIGESRIADILDANDIQYVRDKKYLSCKNDKTNYALRFDFRIFNNENECLYFIEYDGQQHFQPAPMWDNNGDLEERQRRDEFKNEWCLQNGFPLIRIPYTHLSALNIDDLRLESTRYRVV